MAIVKTSYTTGDDTNSALGSSTSTWKGQTFTTDSAGYPITAVTLRLWRQSAATGDLTVSIRATSSGLPTGADLVSATIAVSTISTTTPGEFYTFTFSSPYTLSGSTVYAICARRSTTLSWVYWRFDDTSPSYTDGQGCSSTNAGSTWSALSTDDMMFEVYGQSPMAISGSTGGQSDVPTAGLTIELLTVDLTGTCGGTSSASAGMSVRAWRKIVCEYDSPTLITIRANTGFNYNGTSGATNASAGIPTAITVGGGIITAITKVAQQAHTVDADGSLADVTSKFNALLVKLETLGFLASE